MKYEIMLGILFNLLSKKSVTAKYLSQKYEISIRSIYRYINCLENAGIPLYTSRGNNGGIKIIDTYKLSSTFMTINEFNSVIDALTAITSSVPDKTLENAILKLKSTIKNEYSGFDVKSGNLIIDAGPWGDVTSYKSKLSIIEKSIDECKQLKIKYHDRNGEISERIIEPHVIVFKQGLWYTYAFCNLRKEFRFFKTGRIEKAEILNNSFTRKDLSSSDLPLDFWHNSVKAIPIELEVKNNVISDIEEWLGIENVENINGRFYAKATLPFDNGLISKLMSFGSGIKIISPEIIKEKIKENANELLKLY